MSGPVIQGWCPGAHRPMAAADGLVVRVRPSLGQVTPAQARGIADLALRFGTGLIELTSRANLQLRGVADHTGLMLALDGLGLIDADPAFEARRNITLTPFRDAGGREEQIAAALEDALRDPGLASLPGKFGFVVDTGAVRRLAATSGDIRLEAAGGDLVVRADGCETGMAVASISDAVEAAVALARWFLGSGGVGADGRGRMARHLMTTPLPEALKGAALPDAPEVPARPGFHDGLALFAAPFGQMAAQDLRALADAAPESLRVTPWRMLALPGLRQLPALPQGHELIVSPDDPRLRVLACTGAPGCPQASVETRQLAARLAPYLPDGELLHVSGCAKGCAHPARATVTLVGRAGKFDLIRDGAPWGSPDQTGLAPETLTDMIR
jgi:precorrin-3B synthase